MRCVIWYYLYNSKNVKNTHGGVLILTLIKLALLHGCFSRFLYCTNGTKTRNASQMSPGLVDLCASNDPIHIFYMNELNRNNQSQIWFFEFQHLRNRWFEKEWTLTTNKLIEILDLHIYSGVQVAPVFQGLTGKKISLA